MRNFGFSTGALAKSDVGRALALSTRHHAEAVEYSALRLIELPSLVEYLLNHGPGDYGYASFHAPSQFTAEQEPAVVKLLKQLVDRWALPIVVHPDCIHNDLLWHALGDKVCVENMDHRKEIGRTASELELVFQSLPQARL